ncbi:YceI family protein [Candidatus Woesearchaeota archaeon]|nr:YceI family protein [Candidatus Woesearchaeota archaeon]MCF7900942.1 YceI family protein [Candidatus Woesearchaeota archaeon]MCF8012860.1 YceI family protein [Candidatus Woesearchaeota archaeon]
MKKINILIIMLIGLMILISACVKEPPKDVPQAKINQQNIDQPQNNQEQKTQETQDQNNVDIININKETSKFEFEGYAVGKSHIGTFDEWDAKIYKENDEIIKAEATINPKTVNTGINGLDNHLKNEDFFEVEVYEQITIISKKIDKEKGEIIADLTFRGITNEIIFPAEITQNSIKADFLLDTMPYEMKYVGVNKDVRISFEIYE